MHIRHINSLCCLDNVLQYFHTKLIVQTHSFHGKVIKRFSVKVGILGKSTQSKLLQALNWQITYPNKKNGFGTMQFFKKSFFVFKQILISIRSYQRSSRKIYESIRLQMTTSFFNLSKHNLHLQVCRFSWYCP